MALTHTFKSSDSSSSDTERKKTFLIHLDDEQLIYDIYI